MDIQKDRYKKIESGTKKAWELNWNNVSYEAITEIFDYPRVRKLTGMYIGYLPKCGVILEAGCGLGQWVGYFASRGYDIAGIDYNVSTVLQAKSYDQGLSLAAADVRALPFKDESISAYLSYGVIEHFIEGPDRAISESYRVLKKNGIAVILVPNRSIFTVIKSPVLWLKRSSVIRRLFSKEAKVYYYQRYFVPRRLIAKFKKVGYEICLHKGVDHIFALVEFSNIFRKKNTYDRENVFAVGLGNVLKKIFPCICAGSNLFILRKP